MPASDSSSPSDVDVLAEVRQRRRRLFPRTPEDRPAGKTEDDAQHGQMQEDAIAGIDREQLAWPKGALASGSLSEIIRRAGRFQKHDVLLGRADLADQRGGQLAMLVIHQLQVEQERAVGDDDELAVLPAFQSGSGISRSTPAHLPRTPAGLRSHRRSTDLAAESAGR